MWVKRLEIPEDKRPFTAYDGEVKYSSMPKFEVNTEGCEFHQFDIELVRLAKDGSEKQNFNLTIPQILALAKWAGTLI